MILSAVKLSCSIDGHSDSGVYCAAPDELSGRRITRNLRKRCAGCHVTAPHHLLLPPRAMAYARRVMAHAQRLMTARRPLLLLIGGGSALTAAALTARHYDAPPLPQLHRLRLEAPTSTPADNAKPSFSRWSPLRKGPLVDDATVVSTSTSAAHATPSSCSPQCPGRIADVAADGRTLYRRCIRVL